MRKRNVLQKVAHTMLKKEDFAVLTEVIMNPKAVVPNQTPVPNQIPDVP